MKRLSRGVLVEYSLTVPPLALAFDFNPQQLSRTRSISVKTGSSPATRGGYDFELPTEAARAAMGVEVQPETFSVEILLDATDALDQGDPLSTQVGVEPELDTLRTMVEPKAQGPDGLRTLAALGQAGQRAFQRHETPSVILFLWGTHLLPIFLTRVEVRETAHLPNLAPYRAEVTLGMQVIESHNPFYLVEQARQVLGAALGTGRGVAEAIGGIL